MWKTLTSKVLDGNLRFEELKGKELEYMEYEQLMPL